MSMSTSSSTSTTTTAAETQLTTKQRVGLALCGVYSLVNLPSAFTPAPDGAGDAPPLGILVICSVLGLVGVICTVLAWRGNMVALRVAAGAIIVITLTGLPAFFVDVPMWVKALVGSSVLITVLAVALMFSGRRHAVVD
jgi:hypothetical protein